MVFQYLRESHQVNGTSFAYVNFQKYGLIRQLAFISSNLIDCISSLFSAIASNPESFGYHGNPTCLVSATTTVGGCSDPNHSVFWIRKLVVLCIIPQLTDYHILQLDTHL